MVNDLEYLNNRLERLAQSEENKKASAAEGEEKSSVEYTTDNKPVAVIDEDILDGVPKSDWVKTVKETISKKFSGGIPIGGRLVKVNKITRNEYTNSKYSKVLKSSDGTIYADKFKSANNLDEIVLASTNYINEDLKHSRKDNFQEFARGDVLIRVGNNDYSAKVIIGFTSGNQMVLYDVVGFKPTTINIKERTSRTAALQNKGSDRYVISSTDSISNSAEYVKKNNSENTENYSENAQNVDEKHSIPLTETDKLLDKYDKGEITREEYYEALDRWTSKEAKMAAEKYIADWEKKNGVLMRRTIEAAAIRQQAVGGK